MHRRRFPVRIPFLGVVISVVLVVLAYIFGMSWFQASRHAYYQPEDLLIPRMIDVVMGLWCFWIGSSIGSFLNVVAWRMPRGEGVGGRSHCPRCLSQLRARDNFPVFGWLALGGRCRTCRLPISPRYPIVEAAVGLSLTLVAIGQLYHLSLPGQKTHWHGGPLWAPIVDQPVLSVLIFHVFAVAVSWALGLIRMDRHPLPARLMQVGIGCIVVAMLVHPPLMIVSWKAKVHDPMIDWVGGSSHLDACVRVLTSLAAATLIGRSLAKAFCSAADPKRDPLGKSTRRLIDLIAMVAVPSLIVGWQAAIAVTVVATVIAVPLHRIFRTSTDGLGAFALAIPIALTMQLFAWRWLADQVWWPGNHHNPWVVLAWAAAILFVPLWIRDREAEPIAIPLPNDDDESDQETVEAFEAKPAEEVQEDQGR